MNDIVLAPLSGKPTRKEHSFPAAYVLTHQKTGKAYVGSTHNLYTRINQHKNRLKDGTHRNPNLQKAYDDDPRFDLGFIKAESKEEALDIEQHLLDSGHSQGRLFNVATDARRTGLGVPVPEEAKKKLSEAARRQFADEAARQVQSERSKELWKDREFRAKHVGRERSPDELEKLAAARTKAWQDEDSRARLLAHRQSLEFRALVATINAKPVTVNGVTYPSNAEAARQLGIKPDALRARLKRQKLKETTEGKHHA